MTGVQTCALPILVVEHWSEKSRLYKGLALDAFLDDKPETVRAMLKWRQNVYIMDQPYNREVEAPRVKSVDEFLEIVEEKLG